MAYYKTTGVAADKDALFNDLVSFLTGTVGWTMHDDQTGNSDPYVVLHSPGENGKMDKFWVIRNYHDSSNVMPIHMVRYWDSTTQDAYDPHPSLTTTTSGIKWQDDAPWHYWFYCDLDGGVFITAGDDGAELAQHIQWIGDTDGFPHSTDVALTTSSVSSGSDVVIPVDDTSIFEVGGQYTIVNYNSSDGEWDPFIVTAIGSNDITADSLSDDHPSGARIGAKPTIMAIKSAYDPTYVRYAMPIRAGDPTTSSYEYVGSVIAEDTSPCVVTGEYYGWPLHLVDPLIGKIRHILYVGGGYLSGIGNLDTLVLGGDTYTIYEDSSLTYIAPLAVKEP